MPHLKCVTCRTRSYTIGGADPVEALCPGCGREFEPAGALSGLVGFQAVTAHDASGRQQGLVDRLGNLLERRAREQADRDGRWDGGGAKAQAAALHVPETVP
jgi:hypothetical protein